MAPRPSTPSPYLPKRPHFCTANNASKVKAVEIPRNMEKKVKRRKREESKSRRIGKNEGEKESEVSLGSRASGVSD